MIENIILPFLVIFPIVCSPISYIIGRKNKSLRDYFVMIVCAIDLGILAKLFVDVFNGQSFFYLIPNVVSQGLYFQLDGFRAIYGTICALMWTMTSILSHEYFKHYRNRNRYYFFLLLTFAGTMGVFLSGDLYTTFVFFEIMSIASYLMVIHDEKKETMRAGDTYLFIAVLGGMVMLMGLFLLDHLVGTLRIDDLHNAVVNYLSNGGDKNMLFAASLCLLFGFGAKAGMFPLHIWLPKAHPVAPAPASALLSGILTKSGVYGILILTSRIYLHDAFWGKIILYIGVITMFLGALLALFSINLKRTLACSSMSQIGFILVAAGMQGLLGHHNAYAVQGALLHMVNHSIFKLILFMCAGVVYMNCHKLNLNDIRGFGRGKWALNFAFLMGLLGIIGMPLWSGYVSKSLIHDAIVEYIEILEEEHLPFTLYKAIEWIFLTSGGLTAAYMTKLYICVFYEKNNDTKTQEKYDSINKTYMTALSTFAIVGSAIIPPILGFNAVTIMDNVISKMGISFMLSEEVKPLGYFEWHVLKGAVISLVIGALVYLLIVRPLLMRKNANNKTEYVNLWPEKLDLEDLIYRPVIAIIIKVCAFIFSSLEKLVDYLRIAITFLLGLIFRILDKLVDGIVYLFKVLFVTFSNRTSNDKVFTVLDEESESSKVVKLITNSMAYSLILFCIGLCIALIYLIYLHI